MMDLTKSINQGYTLETEKCQNGTARELSRADRRFIQNLEYIIKFKLEDCDCPVCELSDLMNIDRSTLFRKILAITGKNPSCFIRSVRLRWAVELIQAGNLNMSEISFVVGFNSHSYFSKLFKEEFAITPTDLNKYEGKKTFRNNFKGYR